MNNKLGEYLKQLRGKESLRDVAKRSNGNLSHGFISTAERGIGNPHDNETVIETNDFDEAKKEYNKLVESIKLHDHKKNGANLMKLDEFNEYSTEMFYVYGE